MNKYMHRKLFPRYVAFPPPAWDGNSDPEHRRIFLHLLFKYRLGLKVKPSPWRPRATDS